jgi:hypothetical protein
MFGHQRRASLKLLWSFIVIQFALVSSVQVSSEVLITSNALVRTFQIRWKDTVGTGFTIDHGNRQYFVTARHIVSEIRPTDAIEIYHDHEWKVLPVRVVGMGKDELDIAVLACSTLLSPSFQLHTTMNDLVYGQEVSILGYPFGWRSGGEEINRGVPLPFVKSGIVSAIDSGEVTRIFLDVHGNQGFSGGPVLYAPAGKSKNELRVAGVVSFYPVPQLLPLIDRTGTTITDADGNPIAYVRENPGFVVAIAIRHAIDLIDANPIGYQLETTTDSR